MIRGELERFGEMCLLSLEARDAGSAAAQAGAGAIVDALARWLRAHRPDQAQTHLEPGESWLWCRRDEAVDAAFSVAAEGLLCLAKRHPRDIHMEVNE